MFLNKNLIYLNKTYIIFFITLLFLIFYVSRVDSAIFKVEQIEISEPFDENFKKEKVIDKAFILAFKKLINMTVSSNKIEKIGTLKVKEIKNLIDSFQIKNEKFKNNEYSALIEVNFNRQNTFLFFEKKNIFPSIPLKKELIILPIFVDEASQDIFIFNKNPFFENWNKNVKSYHLLKYVLPSEDIDIINVLNKEINNLEEFEFSKLVQNYNFKEYIVCLIYDEKDRYKVYSKIKIKNKNKIVSKSYPKNNIKEPKILENLINDFKKVYEDEWKEINKINRSVKLAINLSLSSSNFERNIEFQKFLSSTDQISKYSIKNFNNKIINYKIIFNGSPKQFITFAKQKNFLIDTKKQVWEVK